MDTETLKHFILENGATRVGLVPVESIEFRPEFRKLCESNACGMFGKSWMCPPLVGEVEQLIAQLKTYHLAVVFQTVDPLEDSYDFEGMMAAAQKMNDLIFKIRHQLRDMGSNALLLGAGGCRFCKRCAKLDDQPCRFPEEAVASLEAYGINVSALAPQAGMKYINGVNTVTYFGAVFLPREGSSC